MKRFCSLVLALLFLLISVSLVFPQDYGDKLRYSELSDPNSLNPILGRTVTATRITDLLFNSLIEVDADLNLTPSLAVAMPEQIITEEGKLVLTFRLREGVEWHDGYPVTADDVVFTFNYIKGESAITPLKKYLEHLERIEKMDDYTIKATFDRVLGSAVGRMNFKIIPQHFFENGKKLPKGQTLEQAFSEKPVGTGPFKVSDWFHDRLILLDTNKQYFREKAYLDGIQMKTTPDRLTEIRELENNEIDMSLDFPVDYRKRLSDNPTLRVLDYLEMYYRYIGYNLRHKFLKEKEVRRALSSGTDREAMVQSIYHLEHPQEILISGPFPQISWAYNPTVPLIPYNPDEAKRLLKEAGFADSDGDGILEKGGEPFEISLKIKRGDAEDELVALTYQENMRDIGVRVNIEHRRFNLLVKKVINQQEFDAVLLKWQLGVDPDISGIFHSSQTDRGEHNFVGYKNDRADRLLEEGLSTLDKPARRRIYNEIHRIIAEDCPYTFLWSRRIFTAVHRRFEGIDEYKIDNQNILRTAAKWWVPTDRQR